PAVLRERQALLARHFGVEWEWVPRERLRGQLHTERYSDALFEPRAFHFHPLKYVQGIARAAAGLGVAVHEASPAAGLPRGGAGWRVEPPAGRGRAQGGVLACGGCRAGLRREVDGGVLSIATYAMATEPLGGRLGEVM